MKLFLILTAILCLIIVGAVAFVWLGVYNVSARVPHWSITFWFLEKVREQSISAHSRTISTLSSENPEHIKIGFRNYDAMCRICHGAPGYAQTQVAKGLYPKPPEYKSKNVRRWSDAELYWIIENGFKMTGMPAFGPTHSKDELWGVVTFLRRLPDLDPKEYQAMVEAAGFKGEGAEDGHHGK